MTKMLERLGKLRNLGTVNKNKVRVGSLNLWFSYETIVAYQVEGEEINCCENMWGTTTGKLLNQIEPDKSKRIRYDEYIINLGETLRSFRLIAKRM